MSSLTQVLYEYSLETGDKAEFPMKILYSLFQPHENPYVASISLIKIWNKIKWKNKFSFGK